jgi:hypothetical protein
LLKTLLTRFLEDGIQARDKENEKYKRAEITFDNFNLNKPVAKGCTGKSKV